MASALAVTRETTQDSEINAPEIVAAADFRVEMAWEHDTVRICPVGEIDLATIARLREHTDEAMAAGPGRVILDLRETTFTDSSALHLAVEMVRWAERTETSFTIIPGSPVVQRTFEVAGLAGRLPFVDAPQVGLRLV